eukprot:TRINITY_DN9549_c1_g1_i6.p1 TRINITY_DN9549_c1_g1~~TRINITY_DN9549_c1_g1_i6.p1  ORF type:complete len:123 (-),score=6.25 TRINITY_DN9549_c1_g1_i6:22-390(-)
MSLLYPFLSGYHRLQVFHTQRSLENRQCHDKLYPMHGRLEWLAFPVIHRTYKFSPGNISDRLMVITFMKTYSDLWTCSSLCFDFVITVSIQELPIKSAIKKISPRSREIQPIQMSCTFETLK